MTDKKLLFNERLNDIKMLIFREKEPNYTVRLGFELINSGKLYLI